MAAETLKAAMAARFTAPPEELFREHDATRVSFSASGKPKPFGLPEDGKPPRNALGTPIFHGTYEKHAAFSQGGDVQPIIHGNTACQLMLRFRMCDRLRSSSLRRVVDEREEDLYQNQEGTT
jgi:hypothetical protein